MVLIKVHIVSYFLIFSLIVNESRGGILYHQDSEIRQSISLNGLWNFAIADISNRLEGHIEKWYKNGIKLSSDDLLINQMPVPSSFNDIPTNWTIRDHVGIVWYEKTFFVPKQWKNENLRVWIRFGSVCHAAEVWINGDLVVTHRTGHLPFHAEVTNSLKFDTQNIIVVAVDNTLSETTIPQGYLTELNSGRIKQVYTFDFFNYAGIDRPVILYTTPQNYIDDITILTDIDETTGIINYEVSVISEDTVYPQIALIDRNGSVVSTSTTLNGSLAVPQAKFWWPYLSNPEPGYLYTFEIKLIDDDASLVDIYRQPVGIRTVTWTNTSLLINNKQIYLRGFGRHEDSDFRGKGLDLALVLRDYNLIKWIGANCYRTSHYPYAEEIMDLADELGIMIIDESPAVNTNNYSPELLINHKKSLTELIHRDKNRPAVIIWSAANEPRTASEEAGDYYKEIIAHIKILDKTRPVTVVNNLEPDVDQSTQYADIASFNLYEAWYTNSGDLDVIYQNVQDLARLWHGNFNIPVLMTEYGGDTQEGLHYLPSFIWSEEYQVDLLSRHFEAFDALRNEGFFIGEMIWNFADFKTEQTYTRVGGNKKGIFTRNRQPKASAYFVRKRYWELARKLDKAILPTDLNHYVVDNFRKHDEL